MTDRTTMHALLDGLTTPACLLDHEGRIWAVNAAWRAYGQRNGADAKATCEGESYLAVCERSFAPNADGAELGTRLRALLGSDGGHFDFAYRCGPYEDRPFRARFSRLVGCTPADVLVIHDELRSEGNAARALAEDDQILREIIEHVDAVFWAFTETGEAIYVSPSFERLFELPRSVLAADPWAFMRRVHEADRLGVQAAFALPLSHITVEYRITRSDGVRHLRTEVFPVRAQEGLPERVVGITVDVSARHRLEQSLQLDHVRLSAIYESSTDVYLTLDAEGLIRTASPASERMFGSPPGALVGRRVSALLTAGAPDPAGLHRAFEAPALLAEGIHEAEGLRADGSIFLAECTLRRVPGGPHPLTLMVRDISARRQLERQTLEVVQDIQQRLGHDLHDGLGQLLTGLAFLVKGLEGDVPPNHTAKVRRISELVSESLGVVRTLAHGLSPLHSEHRTLRDLLEELALTTRQYFGVHCALACEEDAGELSASRKTQLYLIAREAITNAIQHGKARRIELALGASPAGRWLTIQDDGLGMPAEPSSGLGFKSMEYRARLMGGFVDLSRSSDGGTIVRVTFRRDT